jgi:pimeloyl-ACP methyl ester carboxylesterase
MLCRRLTGKRRYQPQPPMKPVWQLGAGGTAMSKEPGKYAPSNGIQLCYWDEGPPSGEPLLLIMGLSSQLIAWPQGFVDDLVGRGYRVIRFDNRDCGLSDKFDGIADNAFVVDQDPKAAAYQLSDLAADTVGLLDHLQIAQAHVVGASMGGMIAQLVAIDYPQQVRTLCSIMSTTGAPLVGWPTLEAAAAVLYPTPADRDKAIPHIANVLRIIGSRTHQETEWDGRLELAEASFDRMFYPEGTRRQFAAVIAAPDRTPQLRNLDVPTLVVHGHEDALINISGGRATHAAIRNSEFLELAAMGHDLPQPLQAQIVAAIDANAKRPAPTG